MTKNNKLQYSTDGSTWATADTTAEPAVTLYGLTLAWDTNQIQWGPTVPGANYKVYRNGGLIYDGAGRGVNDTGLVPSTQYTYEIQTYTGGVAKSYDYCYVTTAARADIGCYVTDISYNYAVVRWSDSQQRGVNQYDTYINGGYAETSWDTDHASGIGTGASTHYDATVVCYRQGVEIGPRGYTSWDSPARPTANGSAYPGVAESGSTGWTGATRRYLTGNNIGVGVSGTFTNLTILVYGYNGQLGRMEPFIDGGAFAQQVYGAGRAWHDFPCNIPFGNGTHSTGANMGGSGWGQTEWSPWSGQIWNYYVATNRLDYWYYTAVERDEELSVFPFWRDEMAEREIYLETWSDPEGQIIGARVTDKNTGELIVEWGEIGQGRQTPFIGRTGVEAPALGMV